MDDIIHIHINLDTHEWNWEEKFNNLITFSKMVYF